MKMSPGKTEISHSTSLMNCSLIIKWYFFLSNAHIDNHLKGLLARRSVSQRRIQEWGGMRWYGIIGISLKWAVVTQRHDEGRRKMLPTLSPLPLATMPLKSLTHAVSCWCLAGNGILRQETWIFSGLLCQFSLFVKYRE